jgi:hypothetical protein
MNKKTPEINKDELFLDQSMNVFILSLLCFFAPLRLCVKPLSHENSFG